MLAILLGDLFLLVGLAVLLLPLLVTELSRPRDGAWGSVFLLLSVDLLTNSDRFRGPSILAVVLSTTIIIRLAIEVASNRFKQLSEGEQSRLITFERWSTSLRQLFASLMAFGGIFVGLIKRSLLASKPKKPEKKWVRPEKSSTEEDGEQSKRDVDESTSDDLLLSSDSLNIQSSSETTGKDS